MENKYEKLEQLLKTVKPADVELPSHKANLKRALLNQKAENSNLMVNAANFAWLKFFGIIAVIAFGAGLVIYNNSQQKPSTNISKSIQSAPDNITDNIILNVVTDNYTFSPLDEQLVNPSMPDITYNYFHDNQGGFNLLIPTMFNETGTSTTSTYSTNIFKYTGKYGYDHDSMTIETIRNFNSYLNDGFSQYVHETDNTITIKGLTLTEYDTTFSAAYEQGSKYYAFRTNDGTRYALYLRSSRSLNPEMDDTEELVNIQRAQYEEILNNVLNYLTPAPTNPGTNIGNTYTRTIGGYAYTLNYPETLVFSGEWEYVGDSVFQADFMSKNYDTINTFSCGGEAICRLSIGQGQVGPNILDSLTKISSTEIHMDSAGVNDLTGIINISLYQWIDNGLQHMIIAGYNYNKSIGLYVLVGDGKQAEALDQLVTVFKNSIISGTD